MPYQRICPGCGKSNEVANVVCGRCGASLVTVDPIEVVRGPLGETPSPPETSIPTGKHRCEECGALNELANDRCAYCDAKLNAEKIGGQTAVRLVWPWGEDVVRDRFRIGRDPPATAQLIAKLSSKKFDNISRQHAEVVVQGSKATVVDLGSSNGTFMNGVRLAANVPCNLQSNAILRFASDLEARAEIL